MALSRLAKDEEIKHALFDSIDETAYYTSEGNDFTLGVTDL